MHWDSYKLGFQVGAQGLQSAKLKQLMKGAESPFPWHIEGDTIRDAVGDLVGHVTGVDAQLIVELVNREHRNMSFDELDDSHPDPFGEKL